MPRHLIESDVFDSNGNPRADKFPGASAADWNTLQNKPATFPPSAHDHNNLYYTKQQVDNISFQAGGGLTQAQVNALISAGVGYTDVNDFKPSGGWTTDKTNVAGIRANTVALQAAIDYACSNSAAPSNVIHFGSRQLYLTDDTLHAGYGTSFVSIILYATSPLTDVGSRTGVGIECINPNVPIVNFQGAYYSGIRNITLIGTNKIGPPAGEDTYGPWILDPNNFKKNGSSIVTAPQCGVSFDAYAGGAPAQPYTNAPFGYNKAVSSHLFVDNCRIYSCILGIGSHISGDGGQGEFIKVRDTVIYGCYEGGCISNSQARLTEWSDCHFDVVYTAVSNIDFGTERNGRVGNFSRCHFSGFRIGHVGYEFTPVHFSNCYSESLVMIGQFGSNQGNSSNTTFDNCHIDFSANARIIPLHIMTGSARVLFRGGSIGGANMDFDNLNVLLDGTEVYNTIYGDFDDVLNQWNGDNEDPFLKWLASSFVTTTGKLLTTNFTEIFQNNKYLDGNFIFTNKVGTSAYPYYDFGYYTGMSGIVGDYYKSTGGNGSYNLHNFELKGKRATFNIDNFDDTRLGDQYNMVRLLAQPGDILRWTHGRLKGVKLLVTRRGTKQADGSILTNSGSLMGPGNDIEALLLNGFRYHWEDNRYFTEQRTETFTPIDSNTIQFSQPVTLKAGVIINTLNAPAVPGFLMRVTADVNNATTATIVGVADGGGIIYGGTFTFELHHQVISTAGSNVIRFTTPITAIKGEIPFFWGHSFGAFTADITNSYTGTVAITATENLQGDLGIRYIDGLVTHYMFGLPVPQYDAKVDFFITADQLDQTLFTNGDGLEWQFNTWYWTAPTKATAAAASNVITGVQFVDGAGNASSQFRKHSLIYLYTYANGLPQYQTSKQQMFVIQDIDTVNGTITLDRNVGLIGDVLVYNRWPYDKPNVLPDNIKK
jgi:hypothetical protein